MKSVWCSLGLITGLFVMCCVFDVTEVAAASENGDETQLYIVYLGENFHKTIEDTHAHHHHILSNVFSDRESGLNSLVHHYKHSFNGFSAKLSAIQADTVSKLPGVISLFRSEVNKLRSTRSWTYLGLDPSTGVWPDSKFGEDIIVGVLDTGIWPESRSFNDTGLSPVPSRWKGNCTTDVLFDAKIHCNNKLIGAKYYINGYEAENSDFFNLTSFNVSVRDEDGHGTHTASKAAGARVDDVDYLGLASGTAVGGAPAAKLAIYKVCWLFDCTDADILAAFDDAVKDGVDILSISLAFRLRPFFRDSIAIGGFHATAAGILVMQAAGNDGYSPGTISSVAPWLLSVGASTMDREITSDIVLGDATLIQGLAVNSKVSFVEKSEQIVRGLDVALPGVPAELARSCEEGSLSPAAVAGKVIVCQPEDFGLKFSFNSALYDNELQVYKLNGSGFLIVDKSFKAPTDFKYESRISLSRGDIPGVGIDETQASTIFGYMNNSTSTPTVTIRQPRTTFLAPFSPRVASFSSSGPNVISPFVFKPDLTAPGLSILAAWTETPNFDEVTVTPYRMLSGTSMACPHAAGAAALLKYLHPTWSPAAIKSALMTTATFLPNDMILSSGAGEIKVARAADPGLIYNISTSDYVAFLCAENYTSEELANVTGVAQACPASPPKSWNLNYPIITAPADVEVTVIQRKVTNVGEDVSTYRVEVETPVGTNVTVQPAVLAFKSANEELPFNVTIQVTNATLLPSFGVLRWTDGIHNVTSRIFMNTRTTPEIPFSFF